MATILKGGSELRVRLANIARPFPELAATWQKTATSYIRAGAPARTGHLRNSIRAGYISETGAAVMGDYWAFFIDRGTKAHDIAPKSGRVGKDGRPAALKWEGSGGRTIFARKVHRRRTARRPFVTQGALRALRNGTWTNEIEMLWGRKNIKKRFSRVRAGWGQ